MIVTYPQGLPALPGLFPERIRFGVADPPIAEVKLTQEQAHPSATWFNDGWWYLPKVNTLIYRMEWQALDALLFARMLPPTPAREVPEWCERAWREQMPWWFV